MAETTSKTARDLFGPATPSTTTRQRLIDAAIELFHAHGFHAVGLDRVLEAVGITKTAFYNHFESKDDLIIAAVQQRDAWEFETFMRLVQQRAGDDARAQLVACFDVMHEWFNHPDYEGCIFLSATAEFPSPHDPVHQAAAAHKLRYLDMARVLGARARLQDVEPFAHQFVLLMEGATAKRQAGDNDAAVHGRRLAELLLAAHGSA